MQGVSNPNNHVDSCYVIYWYLALHVCKYKRESYCLSTNRAIGREAITLSYIYKSTTRLWVDQVQSLGIIPMADTLPNYLTIQYLPVISTIVVL